MHSDGLHPIFEYGELAAHNVADTQSDLRLTANGVSDLHVAK